MGHSKMEVKQEGKEQETRRSMDPRLVGYPSRLNLYVFPPPYEIKIEQFEQLALDRLTVLKAIETAGIRNSLRAKDGTYNPTVLRLIKEKLPLARNSLLKTGNADAKRKLKKQLFEERKRDHLSHFILRLAFCQSADLRSWFTKLETDLFRIRLTDEDSESIQQLIHLADFGGQVMHLATYKPPKEELAFHSELLLDLQKLYNLSDQELLKQSFFKVPFETVLEQVSRRQVIIKRGFAFVPRSLQSVLVVNMYKERLVGSLEALAKAMPGIEEDEHVTPILASLAKQHLTASTKTYGSGEDGDERKFTHADIDSLAAAHFAPCMKNLHSHLRANAHLKHFGRLQYGLFIKGIGLPYEESLTFWRKAFHRMSDEQFQKGGHVYNIRHSYGLEGKRQDYSPYSCMKIITSNHPGAGDYHGCPFKHFSSDNLRSYVTEYISAAVGSAASSDLVQAGAQEVATLTRAGHFQVACTRLFEITHPAAASVSAGGEGVAEGEVMIEHPNQYFELSLRAAGEAGKPRERGSRKIEDAVARDVVMEEAPAIEPEEIAFEATATTAVPDTQEAGGTAVTRDADGANDGDRKVDMMNE